MSEFWNNRKEDFEQLKYLLKHKKDVYQKGRELGAPRLQLLLHDKTKFKPKNWVPYREYWFGESGAYTLGDRSKVPSNIKKDFKKAVGRHFKAEDHHMHKNPRQINLNDVPLNVRKEMLADWYAVSKHMSKERKFPGIKNWADSQGYTHMYKKASRLQRLQDLTKVYLPKAIKTKDTGKIAKIKYEIGKIKSDIKSEESLLDQNLKKRKEIMDFKHFNSKDNRHIMSWHEQDMSKNAFWGAKAKKLKALKQYKNDLQYGKNLVDTATTDEARLKASGKLSELYVRNRYNTGGKGSLTSTDIRKFRDLKKEVMKDYKTKVAFLRKRKNMPQVDINKALKSKDSTKAQKMKLGDMKPSQSDFSNRKVGKFVEGLKSGKFPWKPLFISSDNYIVDGHHRWKAALKLWGPDKEVKIIRLSKTRKEALDKMKKYEGKEKKAMATNFAKRYLQGKADVAQKMFKAKEEAKASEPVWGKELKRLLKDKKKIEPDRFDYNYGSKGYKTAKYTEQDIQRVDRKLTRDGFGPSKGTLTLLGINTMAGGFLTGFGAEKLFRKAIKSPYTTLGSLAVGSAAALPGAYLGAKATVEAGRSQRKRRLESIGFRYNSDGSIKKIPKKYLNKKAEAESKSQQRLMGMVHAYQNGSLKNFKTLPEGLRNKIKSMAMSMSSKQTKEYAETSHKGLKEKKS